MRSIHHIPWWMRIFGSVWTARLAILVGACAFGYFTYRGPPVGVWPWARLALICLAPAVVFLVATKKLIGRGDIRCPSCRRLTRYVPKPKWQPGMSEPHLRCNNCGRIIGGM